MGASPAAPAVARGLLRALSAARAQVARRGEAIEAPSPGLPDPAWSIGCAAITGWRLASEVLTLKWSHVNLAHRRVRITATKGGAVRTIYVRGKLLTLLEVQWQEHELHPECPWVFHRKGRPIRSLREAWLAAVDRAGLPGCSSTISAAQPSETCAGSVCRRRPSWR